jgi:hypothetical protein
LRRRELIINSDDHLSNFLGADSRSFTDFGFVPGSRDRVNDPGADPGAMPRLASLVGRCGELEAVPRLPNHEDFLRMIEADDHACTALLRHRRDGHVLARMYRCVDFLFVVGRHAGEHSLAVEFGPPPDGQAGGWQIRLVGYGDRDDDSCPRVRYSGSLDFDRLVAAALEHRLRAIPVEETFIHVRHDRFVFPAVRDLAASV